MASLPSGAGYLNHYYHKFLNSLSVGNYAITKSSSHVIPTRTQGKVVWQDKALLLGDAAGLADPLTGEGIHNAVLSAQLAAPVIEDSLAHGKVRLEDYQEAVDKKIVAELRIARVVSKVFVRLPQLMFATLKRSDDVWRAGCGLVSGQLRYSDIKEQAGGFKGIFKRLLLA
jgi:flavin-dependent dehydrogenase